MRMRENLSSFDSDESIQYLGDPVQYALPVIQCQCHAINLAEREEKKVRSVPSTKLVVSPSNAVPIINNANPNAREGMERKALPSITLAEADRNTRDHLQEGM